MPARGRSFALAALLLLSCRAAGQSQPQPIGFVVSFHGVWHVAGRPLKMGEPVFPNATLVLAPTNRFDSAKDLPWTITVVLLDSTTKFLSCSTAAGCAEGLRLPESFGPPTDFWTRLGNAAALLFKDPNRYASLLSRGAGDRHLVDGVARRRDAGNVDLDSLFQAVSPGRYRVEFRSLESGRGANRAAAGSHMAWNGREIAATPSVDLAPGLYAVSLSSAGGDRLGRDAWVLVADSPDYAALAAAFDAAKAITTTWAPRVAPEDVDRFLRAYLSALAEHR